MMHRCVQACVWHERDRIPKCRAHLILHIGVGTRCSCHLHTTALFACALHAHHVKAAEPSNHSAWLHVHHHSTTSSSRPGLGGEPQAT